MSVNYKFGDALSSALAKNVVHTYQLTAASAGEVHLKLRHPTGMDPNGSVMQITLRDSSDRIILSERASVNDDWTTTIPSSGNYTVSVQGDSYGNGVGQTYTVLPTLLYTPRTVYDGPANIDAASALQVPLGSAFVGSLTQSDSDYFKVTAPAGGLLKFAFQHRGGDGDAYAQVRFVLTDSAGQDVKTIGMSDDGSFVASVASAGDYGIRISSAYGQDQEGLYSFVPTFTTTLDTLYDGAGNNSASNAQAISLARPVVGELTHSDVDYFRFTAPEGGELFLNFAHPDGVGSGGARISVSVVNAATNALVVQDTVTGSALLQAPLAGGGDYLIRIAESMELRDAGVYSLIAATSNRHGDDAMLGTPADDFFKPDGGNDTIIGRGGFDIVQYTALRSQFSVTVSDAGMVVDQVAAAGGRDTLLNVARVEFADRTIDLGTQTNAAQIYRLYDAAFDRGHDLAGMGYWIDAMEQGLSLNAVAHHFVASAEFTALYSAQPSHRQLVTTFYEHILQRQPEQAGIDYWTAVLDRGASDAAGVLAAISESAEHQVLLIGEISQGVTYIPFV